MSDIVSVAVHPSQFPAAVRRDLITSLRTRQINHKFHYDSVKQTHQWLALHQAHSPSRHDRDCARMYDRSFAAAAAEMKSGRVHLIGLGCGGGQKDSRLIQTLGAGRRVEYSPCDVSVAMVLVARQAAMAAGLTTACDPFVCDLALADDLPEYFQRRTPLKTRRLITFFGMIPNFEPELILPKLAALVRPQDRLLFSANLAPGRDYVAGMKTILPQYDNTLTRDWLMMFLTDLGVAARDGRLRMTIQDGGLGLKRIVAEFHFRRARRIEVDGKRFDFAAGETLRLFFSYRYTAETMEHLLARHGLEVSAQWITQPEEEGVFLCRRIR